MKPVIEEAIAALLGSAASPPSSMVIADLGCSSGPNAVALVAMAVDAIRHCRSIQRNQSPSEVCVLLNDLPSNDFNNVANGLAAFKQKHHQASALTVTTGMVPGSFYTRLFPSGSLHLVCASYSVHWLSKQAPEDLVKNGIPAYDGDDNLRQARRPVVLAAYLRQFRSDFTMFLSLRAQELVPGGRMVLSLIGRRCDDLAARYIHTWERVAFALNDIASRGVIKRDTFDSFYIPVYGPSEKELREIIDGEGSFEINQIHMPKIDKVVKSGLINPTIMANATRAAFEPIIAQHFGPSQEMMDEFVRTMEKDFMRSSMDAAEEDPRVSLCLSLTKRI
ncbi:hypothetical protein ACP70R_042492 [Stipagrostis hirtigluma subsp. patula]